MQNEGGEREPPYSSNGSAQFEGGEKSSESLNNYEVDIHLDKFSSPSNDADSISSLYELDLNITLDS